MCGDLPVSSFFQAVPAALAGWEMRFSKIGMDGTGKANIHQNPGAVVEGVVFPLKEKQLRDLDHYEG